jgi:hypothetical protein
MKRILALVAIASSASAQGRGEMPATGALGISMDRLGSGTTWIPDAVKLPGRHVMAGSWTLMLHGFVFLQADWQQGKRGDTHFGSLNWGMLMADRSLAGGRVQLRFMPSLDPVTVGRCGYPLLLQTGETCRGLKLVDRQHPHDFFKELAIAYERPLTRRVAAFVYAAPAGEPALGPVAFMHRPSAMDEPQAPLGHHWQDATHISFGVVTAGVFTRTIRIEGSAFNGIEPDEKRWNIDVAPLRSFSGRITVNPARNWSVTAGYGALQLHPRGEPHDHDGDGTLDPPIDIPPERRFVASAMHGASMGEDGQWTTTGVVARTTHEGRGSWSLLLESEAVPNGTHTVFGRVELVQKGPEDLLVSSIAKPANVLAGSLGYVREISRGFGTTLGIGGRGTVNVIPRALARDYGWRAPLGAMVFLRLRPAPRAEQRHQH